LEILIIDFVRHVESIGNQMNILQGHLDYPLSETGIHQSKSLSKKLRQNYDVIYVSSSKRAIQTLCYALNIEKPADDSRIKISDNFKEINFGILEGRKRDELSNEEEEMYQQIKSNIDYNNHEGESIREVQKRVLYEFNHLVEKAKISNHNNILIVTHGGVIQVLLGIYFKLIDQKIENTKLISITELNNKWKLIK